MAIAAASAVTSGIVPKYEEQAARERLFLAFLHLIRKGIDKHADHISRAWLIVLFDKVERAVRQGCSIDDVFDALDRCQPRDTRVVDTTELPDEKTPLARPSRGRRT